MKEYQYYAFISYKREDEKWAKWLQKNLESYGFPVRLRKDNPTLPKKIYPIFRDQSELSGGNLKEEIEKGLANSKYLIIICSPRSAQSPWVSKEVQYFIDNGRENHIIPFIIGGTPNSTVPENECFPEGLRLLTGEKEILGININEMGREAAAIKVIARMFNLRFDSLWQRYKRAKRIKIFSYSLLVAILLILAIVIAIILWTKNHTIAEQNNQLTSLVKNLKEENRTISQMRDEKDHYSFISSLHGNDSESGIWLLDFHPYEPLVAFVNTWGTWLHYINTNEEILLPCRGNEWGVTHHIEGLSFSVDGSELIMSAASGTYVWNVDNRSLIKYIPQNDDYLRDSLIVTKFPHFNSSIWLLANLEQLNERGDYYYEFENDILTATSPNKSKSTRIPKPEYEMITILTNPKYKENLFIGDGRAAIFDEETNEFVQFFKGYQLCDFTYSSNGEYLLIDKDIFSRKRSEPDTLKINEFKVSAFDNSNIDKLENTTVKNISVRITSTGDFIDYYYNGIKKSIFALTGNSIVGHGNALIDAFLCNSNKIVGIVNQGRHRVYNASTGNLIGTLNGFDWDVNPLGYECKLDSWSSHNIGAKNVGRELYVVSSGGIIRIYNIDKLVLERVIELPIEKCGPKHVPQFHIDQCILSADGKSIKFKFVDNDIVYECSLP